MKWNKWTAGITAAALLGALTACSGDKENAASSSPEASSAGSGSGAPAPVTLKGMLFGDAPKDLGMVLDEFEKETKDTLNTKLDIQWNPASDHKQKVKLMMAAGESADFVFDADFMNLRELIPQGAYAQLDKYFNNDDYPGLKQAFPPEFVEANKREGHLYTIPFTQYFYDLDAIMIRKDLREKYGLQPIQSYDDLQAFYDKVAENEPGMTPLALSGRRGFYKIFGGQTPDLPTVRSVGIAGINFFVHLSDDLKTVKDVVAFGDPESEYAKLPAPYNTIESAHPDLTEYAAWRKYLEKDVLSQKDPGAYFMSGKAASYESTISGFAAARKKLQETIPGADLEFFVYNAKANKMEEKAIPTNYRSNNSIAIPASSKNIDRTMKFFDWLFSSRDHHDLFEYGIPGTHWEAIGDDQYKPLEEAKNYSFPGYEFTWNPNMIRMNADLDERARQYLDYSAKASTYYAPVLAGFTFNNSDVKSEFANMSSKYEPFLQMLKLGLYPNWEEEAAKMNKELKAIGLDKVRAELQKQVQAYLDGGGK